MKSFSTWEASEKADRLVTHAMDATGEKPDDSGLPTVSPANVVSGGCDVPAGGEEDTSRPSVDAQNPKFALGSIPYPSRAKRTESSYCKQSTSTVDEDFTAISFRPLVTDGGNKVPKPYAGKSTKSSFSHSVQNGYVAPYSNNRQNRNESVHKQPNDRRHRYQHQKSDHYSQNNKDSYANNSYKTTNHAANRWKFTQSLFDTPYLTDSTKSAIKKLLNDEELEEAMPQEAVPADRNNVSGEVAIETYAAGQHAEDDSESSADPGNLNVLSKMTAIEFDRDRYARFGVHESEIKDGIRTDSYKRCIEMCAEHHIKDKVVLVVRCGIGFLPLLCVRYGLAKRVIGLEQSACIDYARRIVNDNHYSNQITLIQSSVQDLKELPDGLIKVDVILSDCLGDCVLGQGDQMEQVIEARDRFLRSKGIMIPSIISLYGQLSEQRRAYENCRIRKKEKKMADDPITEKHYESDESTDSNYTSWWSNVYGFDMRSNPEFLVDQNPENGEMSQRWKIMPEPLNSYFNYCRVVSSSALLKKFELKKCSIKDLRDVQCKDAVLKCITPYTSSYGGDYAHMLELFMTVDFPNGKGSTIGFSTSSSSPCTRYKQTGLLLRDQLLVLEGDKFIINEFRIQRGPTEKKKNDDTATIYENTSRKAYEESLKIRLKYTFVNKYIKANDRRCAYTLTKYLF